MRFTGQVRLPEIDHPGIPAVFLIEDSQAEVVIEGESLGRWSLYDIHVRRLVASAFQVDLAGEEITFLADEPVDFAYTGVEHMAHEWARLKSMSSLRRSMAVRRIRQDTQPSRIEELREAMMNNLGVSPSRASTLPGAASGVKETIAERIARARGQLKGQADEAGVVKPSALSEAEARLREQERLLAEAETKREEAERAAAEARARLEEQEELLDRERMAREAERLERERLEAERLEQVRAEQERLKVERLETERVEAERAEAERAEAERLEQERVEAERLERERLEAERLEAERLEAERLEAETREAERLERERLEAERLEAERLEAERLEIQRADQPASEEVVPSASSEKGLLVDLSDLEEANQVAPNDEREPVLAGVQPQKSGLVGAVRSAFVRGSRSHAHEFTEAPGGLGITRQICVECGYVSISVEEN